DEQIIRIAKTEPTLRDMLQQFRHLFDHLVYGSEDDRVLRSNETKVPAESFPTDDEMESPAEPTHVNRLEGAEYLGTPDDSTPAPSRLDPNSIAVKSVMVIESEAPVKGESVDHAADAPPAAEMEAESPVVDVDRPKRSFSARVDLSELWEQEWRSARRKLE